MPWIIPTIMVGSTLLQANQANKAAQTQSEASDKAIQLQERQYAENIARQKPFYEAGVNALPELVQASKYTPFSMAQFQADPGYGFRLSEGQKAL